MMEQRVGLRAESRNFASPSLGAGMRLSIIYWLVMWAVLNAIAQIDMWETWYTFGARSFMFVFQIAMSWIIIRVVGRMESRSFSTKAMLVGAVAIVVASLHEVVAYFAFQVGMKSMSPVQLGPTLREILFWIGCYLGWSALFLAQQYSSEVVERERQLSELRAQAHDAQMRALRYQINPHFLFNTLNALATLIEERDTGPAERMVLSLSAFLRSTLALDPTQDITLAEELDIQKRYLDIERERFSDRLSVAIEIPDFLQSAKVPSLILQPLVENAVKHGIGALDHAVHIRIRAEADRNILQVHVENDAPERPRPSTGTGVGLRNVAERLATRFGGSGRLTSGQSKDGIFCSTITLPLRYGPA